MKAGCVSQSLPEKQNQYVDGREGERGTMGEESREGEKKTGREGMKKEEGRERENYLIISHSQGG